ncbi:hypothetical protein BpHYR1_026890 [Brachionus plicatilis]|uniref:Uncharacterized protein n=1 Tax=Brachionus plicatilis TaxID=10195 RepID=A0A3M7T8W9_BRAPC|nr:hypothetical protein BpHYR1_026890 [Brachionus plicatilis]
MQLKESKIIILNLEVKLLLGEERSLNSKFQYIRNMTNARKGYLAYLYPIDRSKSEDKILSKSENNLFMLAKFSILTGPESIDLKIS